MNRLLAFYQICNIFSKPYLLIWSVFFLIAVGFGYQGLTRYDPAQSSFIDDVVVYSEIVKNGTQGITTDHRSTRVLVPFLARPIYSIAKGNIGLWNPVQFSLLVVASFFCASLVVLMVGICKRLFNDERIGIVAGLILYANFSVPNLYLSGLVDAAEAFFLLCIVYVLLQNKWVYLPIIAVLGALSKETFLPVGSLIIGVWWAHEVYIDRELKLEKILHIVFFVLISSIVVIALKSYALEEITYLWEFSESMRKDNNFSIERILVAIRRFSYAYIWLFPLSLIKIKLLPVPWLMSAFLSTILIFFMGWWIGASGAAISRYIFNVLAPLLSISIAILILHNKSKTIT
jgi:hypothetical protein